ncbi:MULTISPECIES: DUF6132 family protein [Flammeovirga]|uniref:Uncharacterized protein n=1 Tax=Flammeovirga agarivorans TaxID=2726742 RepID=A0A7X8XTU6_9BACT|nr:MULTISPECIES: DUF6132 family protein [Flammeovirga]NLR89747.1 hypothetical protein [Flammeovirga agarivorans]
MMHFISNYWKNILVVLLGGTLGYSYYYFIGCNNGTCAITSSPVNSTLYGIFVSAVILNWKK